MLHEGGDMNNRDDAAWLFKEAAARGFISSAQVQAMIHEFDKHHFDQKLSNLSATVDRLERRPHQAAPAEPSRPVLGRGVLIALAVCTAVNLGVILARLFLI
jgi:hypothetical protein